jgi:hypothetical protein
MHFGRETLGADCNGSLCRNLALALAVGVCVWTTGPVECLLWAQIVARAAQGLLGAVVFLRFDGGDDPQRLSPSCRLSRLSHAASVVIVLGKRRS